MDMCTYQNDPIKLELFDCFEITLRIFFDCVYEYSQLIGKIAQQVSVRAGVSAEILSKNLSHLSSINRLRLDCLVLINLH